MVVPTMEAYDLAIAYQYFLSIHQNELDTATSGDISAALAHRLLSRAPDIPPPATASFCEIVAAILLEEHALKTAFLRLTGPAMSTVLDSAFDLALPLLEEMTAHGITYEELANRQLTACTMMDLVKEEMPVTLTIDSDALRPNPISYTPLFLAEGQLAPLESLELFAPFLQPITVPQPPLIPVLCHPLQPLPTQSHFGLPALPPSMTPFGPLPVHASTSLPMADPPIDGIASSSIRIPTVPAVSPMPPFPSFVSQGSPSSAKPQAKRNTSTKATPGDKLKATRRKSTASKPKRSPPNSTIVEKDQNIPKPPRGRRPSAKPWPLLKALKPNATLGDIPENAAGEDASEADEDEMEDGTQSSTAKAPPSPPKATSAALKRRKSMPVMSKKKQESGLAAPASMFASEPTRRSRRLNSGRM